MTRRAVVRIDPKRPGKLLETEHQAQCAFFAWFRYTYPGCKLAYAVPNAAKRNVAVASWMKAEGLTAGAPDIVIDVPHGTFHGLRIELKVGNNQLTAEQAVMAVQLKAEGYAVYTCWGSSAAIATAAEYLDGWTPKEQRK